LGITYPSAN